MSDAASHFAPIRRKDGYLPIEDHGLIGDGTTAALVGRDGGISWLCLPRFDSEPVFASILDRERGGGFLVAPVDAVESRQRYQGETGVLVTELRAGAATVRITDALVLVPGADLCRDVRLAAGELVRRVQVLGGPVRLRVELAAYGGAEAERAEGGLALRLRGRPEQRLRLVSSRPLEGLAGTVALEDGDRLDLRLQWGDAAVARVADDVGERLQQTAQAWSRWAEGIRYDGPRRALVRRSAITLKLLDHFEGGAIVAAPTASLPEAIGGERNWDYRFTWVRDAAFSVYALRRVGLTHEADAFLGWVLQAAERHGEAKIMYALDGGAIPEEREVDLEGYRRSRPVRFGNAAAEQSQNDVYGEIVDCAYQWAMGGGAIGAELWGRLRELIDAAAAKWDEPDHGIWEVRTSGNVFTYSAAMCQVALDRGATLAERFGHDGDVAGWRRSAAEIRDAILQRGWSDELQAITEHLGGDGALDASTLALPLRRVIAADHPRMVSTTAAIVDRLGAGDGLLYRYDHEKSPDGLEGGEGAFLLCSFWLVDNLAHQGRLDEARALYESLCDRANPLGLLPEQIDPPSGCFLGNFPQAFSHIGVIASGFNLDRLERRREV